MAKPTVKPTNKPIAPVAVDDTLPGVTSGEGNSYTVSTSTLLSNDTDANGDILSLTAVQAGAGIDSASLSADGSTITYSVLADFDGNATFNYTVSDGKKGTDIGAASVPADAPLPTFSLGGDLSALEGSVSAMFITLSKAATQDITYTYSLASTGQNPATAGVDYIEPTTLTGFIPAGSYGGAIRIKTVDDGLAEPSETFSVKIESLDGATPGNPTTAFVTILDNDGAPPEPINVTVAPDEVEEGRDLSFTIDIGSPQDTPTSLRVFTFSATDRESPATPGADYSDQHEHPTRLDVTIPAGQTTYTLVVPTVDDAADEQDEVLYVAVESEQGTTTALGTIVDNDDAAPPPPSSTSEYSVYPYFTDASGTRSVGGAQEGGAIEFYIQRIDNAVGSGQFTEDARFVVLNVGGSASSDDYLGGFPREVTIPKGSYGRLEQIQTVDDSLVEGNETLSIRVRELNDDGSYGAVAWDPRLNEPVPGLTGDTLTFPILDNDSAPMV